MIKKVLFSAAFILAFGTLQAQDAITATGGNASGEGGSASYSVGQVVYTTIKGTDGSSAQGVQEAYEIFVTTGLEETIGIELEVKVFPNPTTDFLNLNVDNYNISNLSYQLYNVQGRLVANKKIEANSNTINMGSLPRSTYFLKIIDNQKQVKTFKIIKN